MKTKTKRTSKMKTLAALLLFPISSLAQSGIASEIGMGVGGGYEDFQTEKWVNQSKNELLPIIEASASKYFVAYPNAKTKILAALLQIQFLPQTSRQRNHRDLLLDNDPKKNQITILSKFYEIFNDKMTDEIAIPKIKQKLLHELGNLFLIPAATASDREIDMEAEHFADDVLSAGYIESYDDDTQLCRYVSEIPTSYDTSELKTCIINVVQNNCVEGRTPTDGSALSKLGDDMFKCSINNKNTTPAEKRGLDLFYKINRAVSAAFSRHKG